MSIGRHMREVGSPHDISDADRMTVFDRIVIVLNAEQEMVLYVVAGFVREFNFRPVAVAHVIGIGLLCVIGNPTGPTLREGDPKNRMTIEYMLVDRLHHAVSNVAGIAAHEKIDGREIQEAFGPLVTSHAAAKTAVD